MKIKMRRVINLAILSFRQNMKCSLKVSISIALSLILLVFTYTLYTGVDMNKYLGKYVNADFVIGSVKYFNQEYFEVSNSVSDEYYERVQHSEGIVDGGALYYYLEREKCVIDTENISYGIDSGLYDDYGRAYLDLYGADDFIIEKMNVYEGKIDLAKLATGKYILYGLRIDDNGNVIEEGDFAVGDIVKAYVNGIEKNYEIMAKVKMESEINTVRYYSKIYSMYIPTYEYINYTGTDDMMTYMFNVEDSTEDNMESLLCDYVINIDSTMEYKSKAIYINEFNEMQNMIITISSLLCIIIGMIGLLNFINLVVTNIITRKYELSIMQGIGMTNTQMAGMLCFEGVCYSIVAIMMALVAGTVLSLTIFKTIIESFWFCSFNFSLLPIIIIAPVILFFTALVPAVTFSVVNKTSIVARMKNDY